MSFQALFSAWGVQELLRQHRGLSIVIDASAELIFTGTISFSACAPSLEVISDTYQISIAVPFRFPGECPRVRDIGQRISKKYHRLADGSFCLGSPLQLRLLFATSPTLGGFIDKCVIPYLYGYSYFEKYGRPPFGELKHGARGIVDDYKRLLGIESIEGCASFLALIGKKRRVANKQVCPCGSGRRLGRCHNRAANFLRNRLGRNWSRQEAAWLAGESMEGSLTNTTKLLNLSEINRRLRKDSNRANIPADSENAIVEKAVA